MGCTTYPLDLHALPWRPGTILFQQKDKGHENCRRSLDVLSRCFEINLHSTTTLVFLLPSSWLNSVFRLVGAWAVSCKSLMSEDNPATRSPPASTTATNWFGSFSADIGRAFETARDQVVKAADVRAWGLEREERGKTGQESLGKCLFICERQESDYLLSFLTHNQEASPAFTSAMDAVKLRAVKLKEVLLLSPSILSCMRQESTSSIACTYHIKIYWFRQASSKSQH